jgi:hypothetical protein
MSWDIELRCDHCSSVIIEKNYTHNTNYMIREAAKAAGQDVIWWDGFHKLSGKEGAAFLNSVIAELVRKPNLYSSMNPENGWGSYDTLLPALKELCQEIPEYPTTWYVWG